MDEYRDFPYGLITDDTMADALDRAIADVKIREPSTIWTVVPQNDKKAFNVTCAWQSRSFTILLSCKGDRFSVTYVSSRNLDFRKGNKTLDHGYNKFLKYLLEELSEVNCGKEVKFSVKEGRNSMAGRWNVFGVSPHYVNREVERLRIKPGEVDVGDETAASDKTPSHQEDSGRFLELREWTDVSGRVAIAALVGLSTNETEVLMRISLTNDIFSVTMSALSVNDRNFIKAKDVSEKIPRYEKKDNVWQLVAGSTVEQEDFAFVRQAERIMDQHDCPSNCKYQILQPRNNGALCVMGRIMYGGGLYYTGEVFVNLDVDRIRCADGEKRMAEKFFWAGTESYTTVKNVEKTVNVYTEDRQLAIRRIRWQRKLFKVGDKRFATEMDGLQESGDGTVLQSSGTGFFVSTNGYLITNYHVVKTATRVQVVLGREAVEAKPIAKNEKLDLALLKIDRTVPALSFSDVAHVKIGKPVCAVGYPRVDVQGASVKVTKGIVSCGQGFMDDANAFQIDAAVQPGNSGGPVIDRFGAVVGVVCSSLSSKYFIEQGENAPQNVNYAIKGVYVRAFLASSIDEKLVTINHRKDGELEDVLEEVQKSCVIILNYK